MYRRFGFATLFRPAATGEPVESAATTRPLTISTFSGVCISVPTQQLVPLPFAQHAELCPHKHDFTRPSPDDCRRAAEADELFELDERPLKASFDEDLVVHA